jgi:hypothetical protein
VRLNSCTQLRLYTRDWTLINGCAHACTWLCACKWQALAIDTLLLSISNNRDFSLWTIPHAENTAGTSTGGRWQVGAGECLIRPVCLCSFCFASLWLTVLPLLVGAQLCVISSGLACSVGAPPLLLLLLQIRTQPHLGCCLAAATAAASMLYCCFQLVLLCFSSACFWCFA